MTTTILGTILLALAAPAPLIRAEARPSTAIEDPAQAVLDRLVAAGVPGASAAVVQPDGRVRTWTAGLASREDAEALTAEHRLLSGSVGKTYVTGLAHALVHAGELDFDEPLETWFSADPPEWLDRVPNARDLTLRQLLQHRTGIPRYVYKPGFFARVVAEPDHRWTPEELLAYVFDEAPMFAPGTGWAYSDTNYIIVGLLIEEATGRAFYDLVHERLLKPLELTDTIPTDTRKVASMAQGHIVLGQQMGFPELALADGEFVFNIQFEWCGGGWASTPADLARWIGLLYAGRAFEAPYLETMLDAVPAPSLGPGVEYGLGAMIRETPAGPLVYHDGFMPGYRTTAGYLPELDIAVALQVNTDNVPLETPLSDLLVELSHASRKIDAR